MATILQLKEIRIEGKVGGKQVNENDKNEVKSVRDTIYVKVTERADFQVSHHRNEMVNMWCNGGVS